MTYKLNQFVKARKHVSGSLAQNKVYKIVKVEDPSFSRYLMDKRTPWSPEKDAQPVYWVKRNEQITCTLHENLEPYEK